MPQLCCVLGLRSEQLLDKRCGSSIILIYWILPGGYDIKHISISFPHYFFYLNVRGSRIDFGLLDNTL